MKIVELNRARKEFIERTEQMGVNNGVPEQSTAKVASGDDSQITKINQYNKKQEDVRAKSLAVARDQLKQSKQQSDTLQQQSKMLQQQAITMRELNDNIRQMLEIMSRTKLETRKQDYASSANDPEIHGEPSEKDSFNKIGGLLGDLLMGRGRRRGRRGGRYPDRRGRPPRRQRNRGPAPRRSNSRTKIMDALGKAKSVLTAGGSVAAAKTRQGITAATPYAKKAMEYGTGTVKSGWKSAVDFYKNTPGRGRAKIAAAAAGVLGIGAIVGSSGQTEVSSTPSTLPAIPEDTRTEKEKFDDKLIELIKKNERELEAKRKELPWEKPPVFIVNGKEIPLQNISTHNGIHYAPETATEHELDLGHSQAKPRNLKARSIIQTGDTASSIKYGTEMMTAEEMKGFLESEFGRHLDIKGKVGSQSFLSNYARAAAKDPDMAAAQQKYLRETRYKPQLRTATAVTGVDLGARGYEVQEMLYSTGRRFGKDDTSVTEALRNHKVKDMSDADILKTVYEYQVAVAARYAGGDVEKINALRNTLASEGSALMTQSNTPRDDGVRNNALANVRYTTPSGVQQMVQASTTAVGRANQLMQGTTSAGGTSAGTTSAGGTSAGGTSAGVSSQPPSEKGDVDEGSMSDPSAGEYYNEGLKHVVKNHNRVNMEGLHPNFKRAFYTMVGDWKLNHGGTKVYVESAFRTRAQQQALWDNCKKTPKSRWVAPPGRSRHESGFAIDIDRKSAADLERKGLFKKYGFHRPLNNEPWHVEMISAMRDKPVEAPMPPAGSETPASEPQVTTASTGDMPTPKDESQVEESTTGTDTPSPAVNVEVNAGKSDTEVGSDAESPEAAEDGNALELAATTAAVTAVPLVPLIAKSSDTGAPDAPTTSEDKKVSEKAKAKADVDAKAKADVDAKAKAKVNTGAAKGTAKGIAKGASKAVPLVGTVLTATEAVSIMTDDEMTREEKQVAGAGLAGGTAGALAGGAVGAKAGAAIGAFTGPFAPAAVPVLAAVGGIGGSIYGYFKGEELATDYATEKLMQPAQVEAVKSEPGTTKLEIVAGKDGAVVQPKPEVKATAAKSNVMVKKDLTTEADVVDLSELRKNAEAAKAAKAKAEEAEAAKAKAKEAEDVAVAATTASATVATPVEATPSPAADVATPVAATPPAASVAASVATPVEATPPAAVTNAFTEDGGFNLEALWAEAAQAQAFAVAQEKAARESGVTVESSVSPMLTDTVTAATAPSSLVAKKTKAVESVKPKATATRAPATSPASPDYYSSDDVSVQATSNATPIRQDAAAPSSVTVQNTQQQVERQQYDPVKPVIALDTQKQETMLPKRFPTQPERISSKGGVASGSSQRQTISDCPVAIVDGGLLFIQTGYI